MIMKFIKAYIILSEIQFFVSVRYELCQEKRKQAGTELYQVKLEVIVEVGVEFEACNY